MRITRNPKPASRGSSSGTRKNDEAMRIRMSTAPALMANITHLAAFVTMAMILVVPPTPVLAKFTIEPCSNSDSCNALLGYTLYTDLKVSEVGALFQVDPIVLLTANSIDIAYPDVENHILPASLFLKVPVTCSCVDGIRKSVSTQYKTRPGDTLSTIADSIFSGLVSADQIREANKIQDPSVLDVGANLMIPLPCTCFNGTDNGLPAIYLSYVVRDEDTLAGIATNYFTTVSDLMNVNSMGSVSIIPGDILAVPLPACASKFPRSASDNGLLVPNGTYAITASHCVQCSCGPGNLNLYCMPSALAVSCSSMQCRGSNLMLGNVTWKQTTAGCSVTSCSYAGYVNGTIWTTLTSSLQPICPAPQQFPPLLAPPTTVIRDFSPGPAPSPFPDGVLPGTTIPSNGFLPANAPAGSTSGGITSDACSLKNNVPALTGALGLFIYSCRLVYLIACC